MEHSVCLNCNEPIDRKYCSNCGQKTDTHRISMKHFIFHDIIHGVYHLDKGIIYTIKQALVRPGEAAIDYINGKRVRFYNVFYLTLLLLVAGLFIDVLYSNALSNFPTYSTPVVETEESSKTFDLLGKYLKFLILLAVPFLAFNSFILFGKSKLNYTEHIIVSGMFITGIITISVTDYMFLFLDFSKHLYSFVDLTGVLTAVLLVVYMFNGPRGAFKKHYSTFGFITRAIAYVVLVLPEIRYFTALPKYLFLNDQ